MHSSSRLDIRVLPFLHLSNIVFQYRASSYAKNLNRTVMPQNKYIRIKQWCPHWSSIKRFTNIEVPWYLLWLTEDKKTKRALDYLRLPKLKLFHNSCHRMLSQRETHCFKNFFRHCSALSQKRHLKTIRRNYTSKIKKKGEAETKKKGLKNARLTSWYKSSNSQAVRGMYVYWSCFFSDHWAGTVYRYMPTLHAWITLSIKSLNFSFWFS